MIRYALTGSDSSPILRIKSAHLLLPPGPRIAMITIAVIDDDQTLLDLMAEILGERNWKMLALRDSSTAKESLRQARPDAILLDVHFGGGQSGWDVLRELKAEPEIRAIPVIIWSGDVRLLEDKREWLQDQCIPILPKPFDIDDLYECLDKALHEPETPRNERSTAHA
jgi:CheY-like chemotaxis protein